MVKMNFLEKAPPKSRGKKAVFLTITLVLFALILFSLSSLFLKQKQSENFFVQGSIDRVSNLEASIQKSIMEILGEQILITVTTSGDNVTLNETMPVNIDGLKGKLNAFKEFVESEFAFVAIDLNIEEITIEIFPAFGIRFIVIQDNSKSIRYFPSRYFGHLFCNMAASVRVYTPTQYYLHSWRNTLSNPERTTGKSNLGYHVLPA